MNTPNLWKRYQQYLCGVPALGLTLDVSRMRFEDGFLEQMALPLRRAFEVMDALERGAVANPDERRMVGHHWLRAPGLAPSPEIAGQIRKTVSDVRAFAAAVHDGGIGPARETGRGPVARAADRRATRRDGGSPRRGRDRLLGPREPGGRRPRPLGGAGRSRTGEVQFQRINGGIRKFYADTRKLEEYALSRVTRKAAS